MECVLSLVDSQGSVALLVVYISAVGIIFWFKSYGNIKWGIINGWIIPNGGVCKAQYPEAPSKEADRACFIRLLEGKSWNCLAQLNNFFVRSKGEGLLPTGLPRLVLLSF